MLTRQGVIAWRRALTDLAPEPTAEPAARPAPTRLQGCAAALPASIAAELVNALAAITLAGT